ncbi:MAG: hypothetical protein ACRC8A_11205 [Microcoleaceae cyanobacterium]
MHELSWYWTFVRITDGGNYIRQNIPQAKTHFACLLEKANDERLVADNQKLKRVQTQLFDQLQNSPDSATQFVAEICLRCYISNAILQSSQYLLHQFSHQCSIKLTEVLVLILNDVDITSSILDSLCHSYQSFAVEIIKSFNPKLSSLGTWIRLKIRQHPDVRRLFLEHGILMATNWALLNQTQPKDLQVLANCGVLTDKEVTENQLLLQCYHQVYRAQWRNSKKKGVCPLPTEIQIKEIASEFETRLGISLFPNIILQNLLDLAQKIRVHKIREAGGITLKDSIDHSKILERIPNPSAEADELEEQMSSVVECLDQAIVETIQTRLVALNRRTPDKVAKYPVALKLYFCSEKTTKTMTMNDIAERINLKGQYEVTRLLEVGKFYPSVQNRTVAHLKDRFSKYINVFNSPDRLEQIRDAVCQLIERPQKSSISHCESLFIQRLGLVIEHFLHE